MTVMKVEFYMNPFRAFFPQLREAWSSIRVNYKHKVGTVHSLCLMPCSMLYFLTSTAHCFSYNKEFQVEDTVQAGNARYKF